LTTLERRARRRATAKTRISEEQNIYGVYLTTGQREEVRGGWEELKLLLEEH